MHIYVCTFEYEGSWTFDPLSYSGKPIHFECVCENFIFVFLLVYYMFRLDFRLDLCWTVISIFNSKFTLANVEFNENHKKQHLQFCGEYQSHSIYKKYIIPPIEPRKSLTA